MKLLITIMLIMACGIALEWAVFFLVKYRRWDIYDAGAYAEIAVILYILYLISKKLTFS